MNPYEQEADFKTMSLLFNVLVVCDCDWGGFPGTVCCHQHILSPQFCEATSGLICFSFPHITDRTTDVSALCCVFKIPPLEFLFIYFQLDCV